MLGWIPRSAWRSWLRTSLKLVLAGTELAPATAERDQTGGLPRACIWGRSTRGRAQRIPEHHERNSIVCLPDTTSLRGCHSRACRMGVASKRPSVDNPARRAIPCILVEETWGGRTPRAGDVGGRRGLGDTRVSLIHWHSPPLPSCRNVSRAALAQRDPNSRSRYSSVSAFSNVVDQVSRLESQAVMRRLVRRRCTLAQTGDVERRRRRRSGRGGKLGSRVKTLHVPMCCG